MQKLTTVHRLEEAEKISVLLKSRGITTFIDQRDTSSIVVIDMFSRPPTFEVWVVMDEQYADALELLANPHHEVAKPLTEHEINLLDDIERRAYSPAMVSIIRFAVMIFLGTVVLCVIAYGLRRWW